jgi:transglutaminase-like putative cysteine protease
MGQPMATLNEYQQKYPDHQVITNNKQLDLIIEIVDGKPLIRYNESTSLYILGDNATRWADSKEYFDPSFDNVKIEAFSLVPVKNKEVKYPVGKYTKTTEIGDGLFHDDQYAYSFTFPAVAKGTRLVTNTSASTRYAELPFTFYFGNLIPVNQATITVSFTDDVKIMARLFGNDTSLVQFTKTRKGNLNTLKWTASNVESYIRDVESPGHRYFTPHLAIQLAGYHHNERYHQAIGSLDNLYAFYRSKISNLNQNPSQELRTLSDSLCRNLTDNREKVRKIFHWVQKNIKYVAIEDGENGLVPREANLVLQRRYGDCKDKTSLLVTLIRLQGLDGRFAWTGTRDLPYKYSEFPSMLADNHMIAAWVDDNGTPLILDGTAHSHKMEDIPAFIQGKQCLIENGEKHLLYLIPVAQPVANASSDSLYIEIDGNTIKGRGKAHFSGEAKANMLYAFDGRDPEKHNELIMSRMPKASNKFMVTASQITNPSNTDQPFIVDYTFNLSDYLTTSNGNTYLNMNLNRLFQNLSLLPDRTLPVEAEMTSEHTFVCSLTIPSNYKVDKLPEPSSFHSPLFGFRQHYIMQNSTLILTTHITINFQVINAEETQQFREMLNTLNRSYLKSIVLKKT